jgi:hypothetical protein
MIKTAKDGRYGHRDATLILIAFRHGLRASEICDFGMVTGRIRTIGIAPCQAGEEWQALRPSTSGR